MSRVRCTKADQGLEYPLLQLSAKRVIWCLSMLHTITSHHDIARADLWLNVGIKKSVHELFASNCGLREHQAELDRKYLYILSDRGDVATLYGFKKLNVNLCDDVAPSPGGSVLSCFLIVDLWVKELQEYDERLPYPQFLTMLVTIGHLRIACAIKSGTVFKKPQYD